MIQVKDIVKRLTDVFTKGPNSNLGKLLAIMAGQLQAYEEAQNRVHDWREIDQARGSTLDRIGQMVQQPRGVASDSVYRIMLKSKIAQNLSEGDINTIIRVLSIALNVDPSEIRIREEYTAAVDPEPAAISITKLPLATLNAAGMTLNQFARVVQRTVAAGVRVGVIELEGTFSFSSDYDSSETDNSAGFGDIEGTIGGYLGAAYSPEEEDELPI
ncbi:hypothetical protein [Paenibacillus caseinilyticus]|uniref:hypothetical protein n=1 Tax=Paenibacillus caseinilyticus TaxID=3098138 RepID=UPI0022B85B7E|nr:hypothetical protein [Paenibacillus caseinilyticus]MCZ8518894.1 hypothetical protein [Paenibacillus caseinilyticus]